MAGRHLDDADDDDEHIEKMDFFKTQPTKNPNEKKFDLLEKLVSGDPPRASRVRILMKDLEIPCYWGKVEKLDFQKKH